MTNDTLTIEVLEEEITELKDTAADTQRQHLAHLQRVVDTLTSVQGSIHNAMSDKNWDRVAEASKRRNAIIEGAALATGKPESWFFEQLADSI